MGEYANGLINNLIAAVVGAFSAKLMLKRDRKQETQEVLTHAEKHTIIEHVMKQHGDELAAVKYSIEKEFKKNRKHLNKTMRRFTQAIESRKGDKK